MSTETVAKNAEKDFRIDELAPELQRGPDWLRERRTESQDAFNKMALPPRGLHLWRYTDPAKFLVRHEGTIDTAFTENFDKIERLEMQHLSDGHLAAFVIDRGGREIIVHTGETKLPKGTIICSLSEAVEKHRELVEEHLYKLVNSQTGKFEAMNGALWNDGIFLYIPDNGILESPIHLLREAGFGDSAQYPRLLAIVGKNAEATIIDEYGGGSTDDRKGITNVNTAVEIFGKDDSRTRYVCLQRQSSATNAYLTHRAQIARGAQMLTVPLAFGGQIAKHNFGVILNGPGADSNMYGMLFGSEHQHFDNHTLHHHAVGRTTSDIDFKVVLGGKAVSAYTGLIRIDQNAKTCEAYQENRNLMLNKGTRAETIPELEILNEDVSCSHGATIGPIDPLQIHYLQARGIELQDAVRMIVHGFISDSLTQVPADLRERITGFVELRLEHI